MGRSERDERSTQIAVPEQFCFDLQSVLLEIQNPGADEGNGSKAQTDGADSRGADQITQQQHDKEHGIGDDDES